MKTAVLLLLLARLVLAQDLSVAAGGDMIGPYRSIEGIDDRAFRMVAQLFLNASVGFANQEGSLFDLPTFAGYPSAENGGGYPLAPASMAREIRTWGIKLVSKANNHATDWGAEGLAATLKSLADAGVTQAGGGLGDVAARAPAFVDTPQGRVALVSTASTFPPAAVAGPAVDRRGVLSRPRPGISAIHVRQVRLISADRITELRKTAGAMGFPAGAKGEELRIGDSYFRASVQEGITVEADPKDTGAVLAAIREARAHASVVIFAIHAHETAGSEDDMPPVDYEPLILHRANEAPSPDDPEPAAFETKLFQAAIDAGADMVVRTGPHTLNGIEIYKGRPIFYGLGSLFLSFGGKRGYTAPGGQKKTFPEEWFETVVARTELHEGRVSAIQLYPATIESSSMPTDGLPRLASGEQARTILERMRKLSRRFGTEVTIEGAVGVIRPRP